MAEENKMDETTIEKKESAYIPGDRGEIGTPTAGLTIRQMWHEAHFTRRNIGNRYNPIKTDWVSNLEAPSLKAFARELLDAGDATAKEWFANKRGAKNAKRSDKNATRVSLERQASKAARKKVGQKAAPKADATVVKK